MFNGTHLMFHVEGGKAAAQVGRLSTEWRCGDCMIASGGWSLVSGVPDLGTKSRGQRLGEGLFVESAQIRPVERAIPGAGRCPCGLGRAEGMIQTLALESSCFSLTPSVLGSGLDNKGAQKGGENTNHEVTLFFLKEKL